MSDEAVGICSRPEVGALSLSDQGSTNSAHQGWEQSKRLLDFVLAVALIVIVFPLLVAIAVGIKLDSEGSILFAQTRRGLNGKPFKMYKFRTMFVEEQDDHAIKQSQRNDPRVTRFGSVLRKYSLDELPQILNVLRGDMSFVGPRPHAFGTNINGQALPEICDLYLLRYTVRPGHYRLGTGEWAPRCIVRFPTISSVAWITTCFIYRTDRCFLICASL